MAAVSIRRGIRVNTPSASGRRLTMAALTSPRSLSSRIREQPRVSAWRAGGSRSARTASNRLPRGRDGPGDLPFLQRRQPGDLPFLQRRQPGDGGLRGDGGRSDPRPRGAAGRPVAASAGRRRTHPRRGRVPPGDVLGAPASARMAGPAHAPRRPHRPRSPGPGLRVRRPAFSPPFSPRRAAAGSAAGRPGVRWPPAPPPRRRPARRRPARR
jgi:hypothetical protein